jgi:hypothetical protein
MCHLCYEQWSSCCSIFVSCFLLLVDFSDCYPLSGEFFRYLWVRQWSRVPLGLFYITHKKTTSAILNGSKKISVCMILTFFNHHSYVDRAAKRYTKKPGQPFLSSSLDPLHCPRQSLVFSSARNSGDPYPLLQYSLIESGGDTYSTEV